MRDRESYRETNQFYVTIDILIIENFNSIKIFNFPFHLLNLKKKKKHAEIIASHARHNFGELYVNNVPSIYTMLWIRKYL